MTGGDRLWIVAAAMVFIAIPPVIQWTVGRPGRSASRLAGLGAALFLLAAAVAALLGALHTLRPWLPVTVLGAGGTCFLLSLVGARLRWRRAQRDERNRLYARENLASGPARLQLRPRRPTGADGRLHRIDDWLAADGPRPSQGWWNNGRLLLDARGVALIDAAGLRHALPAETVALIERSVPHTLLLVDSAEVARVRLPLAGFGTAELRRFATAAGWRYGTTMPRYRTAADFVDLHRAVVDRASQDQRRWIRPRQLMHNVRNDG